MTTLRSAAIALGVFAGLIAFLEAGYWIGRRRAAAGGAGEGTGTIEAAVFALLGLLLAFTFSGGMSRLDVRRDLVVSEANAIGTAYLRLDLLPADAQPGLRRLFGDYLEARRRVYDSLPDMTAAEAAHAHALEIQRAIWQGAVSACQSVPDPRPAQILLPAINDMIDVAATRSIASATHQSLPVFVLLVAVALLSALLAGYSTGVRNTRSWFQVLVYAVVVALTVYTVLDLEYPRAGLIRVGTADETLRLLQESIRE
jgi:hypothetical protein